MKAESYRMLQLVRDNKIDNPNPKVIHYYVLTEGTEVYTLYTDADLEENPRTKGLLFSLTAKNDKTSFIYHNVETMKDFIASETNDLHSIEPPNGWEWVGVH